MTNKEEFEARLVEQSQEVCTAIAYRAAMRVLPIVAMSNGPVWSHHVALYSFRACQLASLNSSRIVREIDTALNETLDDIAPLSDAVSAVEASYSAVDTKYQDQLSAIREVALKAVRAAQKAPSQILMQEYEDNNDGLRSAMLAAEIQKEETYYALFQDELLLSPSSLHAGPIPPFPAVARVCSELVPNRTNLLKGKWPWSFWAEWYARAMAGNPLPWKLQEQIALIPNEIWKAGPEAVADAIARLEAEFDLRARIAELEAAQVVSEEARLGIGGNAPPEEIDDPEIAEKVVIIWDAVAGLKEEVEAEEPDASRVAALIEKLGAALKAVLAWCGRKGDLVVDTTIKASIGYVIPAGATGYFILVPSKAEAVLKAAQAWLPFLAP